MQQNSNVSKLVEKSIPKTIIEAIPLVAHAIGERDHKQAAMLPPPEDNTGR